MAVAEAGNWRMVIDALKEKKLVISIFEICALHWVMFDRKFGLSLGPMVTM